MGTYRINIACTISMDNHCNNSQFNKYFTFAEMWDVAVQC